MASLPRDHRQVLESVVQAYDSWIIRSYCHARFVIININILHMLALCLRGSRRVLDLGCGFGFFGCYFAALYPELKYEGVDLNPRRVGLANEAAARLGLGNATFSCGDARKLELESSYDAVMMIDLFHHVDDDAKARLLEWCAQHLVLEGRLVIKDVTTHPWPRLAFTHVLDVLMTRSLDVWYWGEDRFFRSALPYFTTIETFPIMDLLPYPHIIYLCEGPREPAFASGDATLQGTNGASQQGLGQ